MFLFYFIERIVGTAPWDSTGQLITGEMRTTKKEGLTFPVGIPNESPGFGLGDDPTGPYLGEGKGVTFWFEDDDEPMGRERVGRAGVKFRGEGEKELTGG